MENVPILKALDKQRMDDMAPMPQIGPGGNIPHYMADYKGPQREIDRTKTLLSKLIKEK